MQTVLNIIFVVFMVTILVRWTFKRLFQWR